MGKLITKEDGYEIRFINEDKDEDIETNHSDGRA